MSAQDDAAAPAVFTRHGFLTGAAKSLVLAPSVGAFGIAVGVVAASKGLTTLEVALMSAWVHAGGAQMALMLVWSEPLPLFTLVLTVLAMNARYVLMGAALRPRWGSLPAWKIYPTLFTLGDGNWALTMREYAGRRADGGFLLGTGAVMFSLWIATTVVGQLFGQVLGDPKRLGIDFMLPAFFATMAVAFFRSATSIAPLAVAVLVAVAVERLFAGPWYIFAGALAGSLAGALRHVDPA